MKKLSLLFVSIALFLVLWFSSVNAADVVEDTWDGWSITTKDDWTVITKYADWTIETVKPDWSSKTVNPDGSTSSVSADGETTETPPTLKSADAIWDIFDSVTNDSSSTSSETTDTSNTSSETKSLWNQKVNFTKPPEENKTGNSSNASSNSSSSNETKQVSNVAVKKLPQTWPTEILLMLFSFILAWIVLYKRKK